MMIKKCGCRAWETPNGDSDVYLCPLHYDRAWAREDDPPEDKEEDDDPQG